MDKMNLKRDKKIYIDDMIAMKEKEGKVRHALIYCNYEQWILK